MPRVSERAQALQDIDHAIECLAYTYALKEPSSESDLGSESDTDPEVEDSKDLLMRESIASQRYLFRGTSAGRHGHDLDVFDAYIYQYPETAFLAFSTMFCCCPVGSLKIGVGAVMNQQALSCCSFCCQTIVRL